MAPNDGLSLEEKQFLVTRLERELRLNQVYGYMDGIPNGDKITRRLQAIGLVVGFPPMENIETSVEIVLSHEGRRRAEELKAEGVEPFTRPPTHS